LKSSRQKVLTPPLALKQRDKERSTANVLDPKSYRGEKKARLREVKGAQAEARCEDNSNEESGEKNPGDRT